MSVPRLLLVAAALSACLAACGKNRDSAAETLAEQALEAQAKARDAEVRTEDGRSTLDLQTDEGRLQHTVGENVPLPDDFPTDVVLPEHYTVVSVMRMGPSQSVVLRSPEPLTALVERYQSGQAGHGWRETLSMQGPEGAALGFEKAKRGMLVNLRPDLEGQTTISLSLQAP
jgi:hypothetical protein